MIVKDGNVTNEDLEMLVGSEIIGLHLDCNDSDFTNSFILQTSNGSFRITLDDIQGSLSQSYELTCTGLLKNIDTV